MVLTLLLAIVGCEAEAEKAERLELGIESDYVSVLSELTSLMLKPSGCEASESALSSIREYSVSNRARISEIVNTMNRSYLTMGSSERDLWRKQSGARVSSVLDAYARAYRRFSDCLSEAQKWELGELLSQLR